MLNLSFLAKILFVGHSLVGPDLPGMVETGLRYMGQPSTVEAQVINGAPLRVSLTDGATAQGVNAKAELEKGETEVLILTEATPLADQVMWNDTVGQVMAFAKLANEARPDTRVFLYETWPSRLGVSTSDWLSNIATDLSLWEDVVSEASVQGGYPVKLIPAAQAFALLAQEIDKGAVPGIDRIDPFFSDDIHLSDRGKYFIALVHLTAITGKSPKDLPSKLTRSWSSRDQILSDRQADALQDIAWRAVTEYRPQKREVSAKLQSENATKTTLPTSDFQLSIPATTDFSKITNANLALGLNGLADWSVQVPFLDLMKMSREWTGHLPGQYGGWDAAKLASVGALDEHGWVKRIPAELTGISTLILTDLPPDTYGVAGRYLVTWDGDGDLKLGGRAENIAVQTGQASFDFAPGPSGVELMIQSVSAENPIRDIKIIRQDRLALYQGGEIFNPDWLARIKGVRTIRFMDWMATNNSKVSGLKDRPKVDDYTYTRAGAPMEIMIALANKLGANPWFNIPHLADDDLIRLYAKLAHDELDQGLIAHVEFSNEVWNWSFGQASWAEAEGKARWGRDATWVQYYALRASEMADIWLQVYGEEAEVRLKRVLATQTGWLGLEDQILKAPEIVSEGKPAPYTHFDAYAVTGYFSAMLGSDDKRETVHEWIATSLQMATTEAEAKGLSGASAERFIHEHRYDLAFSQAKAELASGAVTGDPTDSLSNLLDKILPYQANVAIQTGLELIMYEGGSHVVGMGASVDDPELTAFFQALNYSPQMAELYASLMQGWAKLTPAPFNAFVDVSAPSKWGSWGALRHLGDENPRWQMISTGCPGC